MLAGPTDLADAADNTESDPATPTSPAPPYDAEEPPIYADQ